MLLIWYYDAANLLIGQEFDASVGENAEEGCGVAAKEAADSISTVDVPDGLHDTKPATGVFLKLWIRGLEKDLYAIKGSDNRFSLDEQSQ